jgi:hypothetical protein
MTEGSGKSPGIAGFVYEEAPAFCESRLDCEIEELVPT